MSNKNPNVQNAPLNPIRKITVYAASSGAIAQSYFDAASGAGRVLAENGISIIYGGGSTGLMGAIAQSALDEGSEVHGVVPQFLKDMEVSHNSLTSLTVVNDMRERKHLMLHQSNAVLALPGGCGTYEEVFEALTLKRLGQWLGPIVLLNTNGFYDRLADFLQHAIAERFMAQEHTQMWSMVNEPEHIIEALHNSPAWGADALQFATLSGHQIL